VTNLLLRTHVTECYLRNRTVLSFEKALFLSYRKWRGSFHDLLEENQ
jgi:hypothetical protein